MMKGRWGLRLCWNLFCLLFFVSYTSKAIRVLPKLRSKRPIVTDVPTHDDYSSVVQDDTASLIRTRRVEDISYNQYNISIFSKTTVIDLAPFEWSTNSAVRSSIRWVGSSPYQVSDPDVANFHKLNCAPMFCTFTVVFTASDYPVYYDQFNGGE